MHICGLFVLHLWQLEGVWVEAEARQAEALVQHLKEQRVALNWLQDSALAEARAAHGRHTAWLLAAATQKATVALAADASRARLSALSDTRQVLALVKSLLAACAARGRWLNGVVEARLAHWANALADVEADGLTDYLAATTAQLELARASHCRKTRSVQHLAAQLLQYDEVKKHANARLFHPFSFLIVSRFTCAVVDTDVARRDRS